MWLGVNPKHASLLRQTLLVFFFFLGARHVAAEHGFARDSYEHPSSGVASRRWAHAPAGARDSAHGGTARSMAVWRGAFKHTKYYYSYYYRENPSDLPPSIIKLI